VNRRGPVGVLAQVSRPAGGGAVCPDFLPGGSGISPTRTRPAVARPSPVDLLRELTPRDLYLLDVLSAHRVLTAEQVGALLFPSLDRAQRRLLTLTRRGLLDRFRICVRPGSQPWRYTLGHAGAVLVAATRAQQPPARAAHERTVAALARSGQLAHRLGVNGVFTDLAGVAAATPGGALMSWYSEAVTTTLIKFARPAYNEAPLRPDGYGRWQDPDKMISFLLEYDTGSEPLDRLTAKIDRYRKVIATFRMPVLFHLPSTARETNLHRRAGPAAPRGIATTAADLVTASGHTLAGPVWLPLGERRRRRLIDLGDLGDLGGSLWADYAHTTASPPARHLPMIA